MLTVDGTLDGNKEMEAGHAGGSHGAMKVMVRARRRFISWLTTTDENITNGDSVLMATYADLNGYSKPK